MAADALRWESHGHSRRLTDRRPTEQGEPCTRCEVTCSTSAIRSAPGGASFHQRSRPSTRRREKSPTRAGPSQHIRAHDQTTPARLREPPRHGASRAAPGHQRAIRETSAAPRRGARFYPSRPAQDHDRSPDPRRLPGRLRVRRLARRRRERALSATRRCARAHRSRHHGLTIDSALNAGP